MGKLLKTIFIIILIVAVISAAVFLYSKIPSKVRVSYDKPNILLITAGSLRPDHLSSYGYEHVKTGSIDKLAENGVLFENVYCNAPVPFYSYATIFSGKNGGSVISKRGDAFDLDDSYNTLGKYLKTKEYTRAAVMLNTTFMKRFGYDKEFDLFEGVMEDLPQEELPERWNKLTDGVLEILKESNEKGDPAFIWVSYPIPQFPYKVPETFEKAKDDFPYDRQILLLDDEVSKLLDGIEKLGLSDNTIIIFTATSGESLNEHGEPTHGIFLYDATVRVPLIIKFPEDLKAKKIKTPASNPDIAPTILDIINISYADEEFDGGSLLELMKEKEEKVRSRSIYLESLEGYYNFGWAPVVGLILDGFKYIELPEAELYDLENDPHELKNIAGENPEKASELKSGLMEYLEKKRPELIKILDKGADPKEKIQYFKNFLFGPVRFKGGDINSMITFFKDLLDKDPNNKVVKLTLAQLYFRNARLDLAKKELVELTATYPDFNRAWESLGMVYGKQDDRDNAIVCYEKAIAINPDMPASLNNLAWDYAQKGTNLDAALKYAERAVELSNNFPTFIDTLAEVHLKMGDKEKAITLLEKAISLDPKSGYLQTRLNELEGKPVVPVGEVPVIPAEEISVEELPEEELPLEEPSSSGQ